MVLELGEGSCTSRLAATSCVLTQETWTFHFFTCCWSSSLSAPIFLTAASLHLVNHPTLCLRETDKLLGLLQSLVPVVFLFCFFLHPSFSFYFHPPNPAQHDKLAITAQCDVFQQSLSRHSFSASVSYLTPAISPQLPRSSNLASATSTQ